MVLAILSLAAALAFPSLAGRSEKAALAGAAQQVRAALAAARSAAIADDREVIFGGDGALYRIDGMPHALLGAAALPARISFFPSGGSSGGRVVLRSASARREIEIDRLTGRAVLLH